VREHFCPDTQALLYRVIRSGLSESYGALTQLGVRFPPTFMTTAKTILRRLFRVYAHIYHSHFDQICALGIEGQSALLGSLDQLVLFFIHQRLTGTAHLNTNYRHFLLFVDEVSPPRLVYIVMRTAEIAVLAPLREGPSPTGGLQQDHPRGDGQAVVYWKGL
jgi:hypothetical protein